MTDQMVYDFTHQFDADTDLKSLLGGKGANLNIMTNQLGLPVPQGFTIPCSQSVNFDDSSTELGSALSEAVVKGIYTIEAASGRNFGNTSPLLVSVRSGAAVSMPGMMDTILNLGMNHETVKWLADETNEDFAYDSYRRFVQMYATIVLGDDHSWYADRTSTATKFFNIRPIPADASRLLIKTFLDRVEIPDGVYDQLQQAILAVFRSWNSEKAAVYREIEGIPHDIGTAVNVQRMVFGNLNNDSGTGVAFTRNPNTGEAAPYGDFLVNAQGEDVVDGSTVTRSLSDMHEVFPTQASELDEIMATLENHYSDMCDIEFTIEDKKLFMLQTRIGKRSSLAEVRIVADLLSEGRIQPDEGVERLNKAHANAKAQVDVEFEGIKVATGLGASGGLVVGKAYFTKESAIEAADNGEDVILVRNETSPEDTAAMAKSIGILTLTGGLVSHAAVVARSWDKTAVVGLGENHIIFSDNILFEDGAKVLEGETIGIDGQSGEVFVPVNKLNVTAKKTKKKADTVIKSTVKLELEETIMLPPTETVTIEYMEGSTFSKHGWEDNFSKPYTGGRFRKEWTHSSYNIMTVVGKPSRFIALLQDKNGFVWKFNLRKHNFIKKAE